MRKRILITFITLTLAIFGTNTAFADTCGDGTEPNDDNTSCICLAGYENYNSTTKSCTPCSAGTYKASAGNASCTACEQGTYQDETGQKTCKPCTDNSTANETSTDCLCNKGYSGNGKSQCTPCPAGTYKDSAGNTECTACEQGTYQNQQGKSNCTPCPKGQYQDQTGKSSCNECSLGYYQDQTGKSSCTPCGANQSTQNTGSTSANRCLCIDNYYLSNGTCTKFANGTCSNLGNDISRCTCNMGYDKTDGGLCSNNCVDFFTSAQTCIDGSQEKSCIEISGTLTATGGYDGCRCTTVEYTHENTTGNHICKHTATKDGCWEFYELSADKSCVAGTCIRNSGEACTTTHAGEYAPGGSDTVCRSCTAGTYSGAGAASCIPCSKGYYQNETGQTSCKECDEGYYQDETGQKKCEQCPKLTVTAGKGTTSINGCFFGGDEMELCDATNGCFKLGSGNKWTGQ